MLNRKRLSNVNMLALLFFYFFYTFTLFAQKTGINSSIHPLDNSIAEEQIGFVKASLHNSSEAMYYLKSHLKNLSHDVCSLRLVHETKSKTGKHYLFSQTIFGYPVYRSDVKMNTDNSGNITSLFDHSFFVPNLPATDFPSENIGLEILEKYNQIDNYKMAFVYFPSSGDFIPSLRLEVTTNNDISEELIIDKNKNIIYRNNLNAYFNNTIDTTISAYVFVPDPITSGNYTYGSPIVDSSDISYPTINSQLISKNIKANYQSGVFTLENSYAKIQEHSAPVVNPVSSTNNILNFDRYSDGFEDVNALYHITEFQHYLQRIGIFDAANYQIAVDTHGLNGADNSVFTSSTIPPRLTFGEGGVDDAEDADVIIHEYGHAISYSCAPGTNNGTQRKAMDEGMGDFFASSYSRMLNSFGWYKVFSWDGHNEYWGGRVSNSTLHYPNNLTNQIHTDGQIWSSVLMEIWNDLGPDTTTILLIEALHSFSSNMSMSAAARLYIQADSNLYGGMHYTTICTYFYNRGLVSNCESYLNISETKANAHKMLFYPNPTNGWIYTEQNKISDIVVYDIYGRIVYSNKGNSHDLCQLSDGVYIVSCVYNGPEIGRRKLIIRK